jgi:hypothetical protein
VYQLPLPCNNATSPVLLEYYIPPLTVAEDTSHHARLDDIDLAFDQREDSDQQFDGITEISSAHANGKLYSVSAGPDAGV